MPCAEASVVYPFVVVPVGTPRRRRRKIIYIDLLRTAPRADGVWGLRPSGSVRGGRLYEETLVDAVVAYTYNEY